MKQIKLLGFKLIDEPKSDKVTISKEFPSSKVIIEFKGTAPPLDAKMYYKYILNISAIPK